MVSSVGVHVSQLTSATVGLAHEDAGGSDGRDFGLFLRLRSIKASLAGWKASYQT